MDSSEELFRKIYNKEIETDDELMRFLSFLDTNMNPSILKVPLQEIPSTREELYVKLTSEMGIYPDMAYRIISIVRKGKVATNIEELSDLPPTLLDWLSDIKYMYSKSYLLVEIKILKELLYYKSFHKKDYIEAKKIIIDENEQG